MISEVIIIRRPLLVAEMHVFHYPAHSAVCLVATADDDRCHFPSISHEHTRAGGDLLRFQLLFPTRADAETYVSETSRTYAETDAGAVLTIFRHDAIPASPSYAVKITAKKDENGNPRRGWIIYDHTGKRTGFIDEGFEHDAALAEAGHVIELGPIPTGRNFYETVSTPI